MVAFLPNRTVVFAAALLAGMLATAPARPQEAGFPIPGGPIAADEKMLLQADTLIYDFDRRVVTATGGVEIYYGGHRLQAGRVSYDQGSRRLMAAGGVRIVEPDGTVITAREADVTDDFRDGFVDSLNVVTPERARFAARAAERRGDVLVFAGGVYTACEPCREKPLRPPQWQIKAGKIIVDRKEQVVRYENARFELFGVPVLYTPFFFHPEPSAKRRSGFLAPSLNYIDELGVGISIPFYWNIAPSYDLTLTPTLWSEQGLLVEAEWRQRLRNGAYSFRAAGIRQADPNAFLDAPQPYATDQTLVAPSPGDPDWRGSIHTFGSLSLTPRWTLGWDLAASSDTLFTRDYKIDGLDDSEHVSTIGLTGLSDRNFFDLRFYYFNIFQDADRFEYGLDAGGNLLIDPASDQPIATDRTHHLQDEQAVIHPLLDHHYEVDGPLGVSVSFDTNAVNLSRSETAREITAGDDPSQPFAERTIGFAGRYGKVNSDIFLEKEMVGPLGQLFTPFAGVKSRLAWLEPEGDAALLLGGDDVVGQIMPTLGMEYRWPFLVAASGVTQVISPVVQVVARPDEQHIGDKPNDDAQSLFFDDTILFERDKFSGYDRVEGGTRANVGATYRADFSGGMSIVGVFGQSIHIAGQNSFALEGPARTGLQSGLETDLSDYVARLSVHLWPNLSFTARARLDEEDWSTNQHEWDATLSYDKSALSVGYAFMRRQPLLGMFDDREETRFDGRLAFLDNWSVSGGLRFDLDEGSFVEESLGVAYGDECLDISLNYSETRDRYSEVETNRTLSLKINLRTLGGGEISRQLEDPDLPSGTEAVSEPLQNDFSDIGP